MNQSVNMQPGEVETALVLSDSSTGELLKRTWRITVARGPDAGKAITRQAGSLTVGTAPGCDFVLADETVSRRHAMLELQPEGVVVVDLGSRNGIRLGKVTVERAFVVPGGTVRLGRTVLSFETIDEPVAVEGREHFGDFVTVDPGLREVVARLQMVAPTNVTVLLQGEAGTGKRLLARMIHQSSPRAGKPLVIVDCDAPVEGSIERYLFGSPSQKGVLESAEGGTIVLAEVGDLPLDVQARLLEVIETRTLRLGPEHGSRRLDVRFLFTDHRNLEELTMSGEFREDLYYRAAVVLAQIPPLRERPTDIIHIAEYLASRANTPMPADQEMLELLIRYTWPGNVRELVSVMERLAAGGDGISQHKMLMRELRAGANPFHEAKENVIANFERRYVRTLLALNGGNVSSAARDAGMSRGSFYDLMKRAGVELKNGDQAADHAGEQGKAGRWKRRRERSTAEQ